MTKQKKTYAEQLHDRLKHTKIEYTRDLDISKRKDWDIPKIIKAAREAGKTFSDEELRARGFYPPDYQ